MDDLEFVRRCIKGGKQAWDELLAEYSRLIYKYILSCSRVTGIPITPAEKEDIFQELMFSLVENNFRKLKSYRALNGCSFASWLRQVTINFTINRLCRPSDSAVSLDAQGEEAREGVADATLSPAESLISSEMLERLVECMEHLDLEDKYLLELTVQKGFDLERVREHLRLSRGAVDMRKTRVLEILRDCFKSKGFSI